MYLVRKRRVSRRKSKNKSDETKSRPREGTCLKCRMMFVGLILEFEADITKH